MITVKSSVQAVDPACGIWLIGKVLEEREDAFNIRWANYRVSNWIEKGKVRLPVPKRQYRLDSNDWTETQPSLIQKGEEVSVKKADGTSGECITVEENDPFNCVIFGSNRRLKYEWVREVRLVVSSSRGPLTELVNHAEGPRSRPRQTTTTSDDARRQPNEENQENETPRRRPEPTKRRSTSTKATSGAKKTRTLVPKKIATRIAVGPAAEGDGGGPPQDDGMASGCADAATMALHSVVVTATNEGNPPSLPEEWARATPAFGCSAVCDGRFAEIMLKMHEQSEEINELKRRLEATERRTLLPTVPFENITTTTTPVSPPQPDISGVVGSALQTLTSPPPPPPEQPAQLVNQPSPMHLLLAGCLQDRTQMARLLVGKFFSVEERLSSSTSGKRGKALLDPQRLLEVRKVVFDFAPVPTTQAEETEWARLKTVIDQFNRHLRQQLREKAVAQ